MSLEYRTILPHERAAVLDLLGEWFGDRAFFARYFDNDAGYSDALCFVAIDEGRIVSTLQVFRKPVRVQGVVLQVGGVGNVFTTADYRERGLASQLLTRAVAAMNDHEFDLSLLFAVRLAFYGRHGWQSHVRHLTFIDRAEASGTGHYTIKPYMGADLPAIMRLYDAYNATLSGSTVRDRRFWDGQVRCAGNPREDFLVARDGPDIVAYARGTPLYDLYVIMEHAYCAGREDALAQLVCRLHGTEAAAYPGTIAQLAVAPAVRERLQARGLNVRSVEDVFWMWRVISPQRLMAKLGVRESDLEAEDFFFRLLPPEQSVYWIADRF